MAFVFYLRVRGFFAILSDVPENETRTTFSEKNLNGQEKPEPPVDWNAYRLVFEVGYTVAIPLVLFALGGRFLDKKLDTAPWLLLAGVVVSVFISSFLVYRKVSKIL